MEVILQSPVQECSLTENGSPKLSKSQKKSKRKALKISDSKGNEHSEVDNGEIGSSMTTNLNEDVKVEKKMENEMDTDATLIGEPTSKKKKSKKLKIINPDSGDIQVNEKEEEITNLNVNNENEKKKKKKSKNKQPTLAELLNPENFQTLEAAKDESGSGTTSTHNTASKKQKRDKVNKNPELGDIVRTHESGETATSNANMVSKVEDYTEVADGKEKKRNLPTLGEVYHLQHLQNMGTSSKKQKKQKRNKNPDSGDILTTNKVLEVQSDETVSGKTATSDANMVSKGVDHTEGDIDKMQEDETSNLNENGKKKKKKKLKSKNKEPTVDESLNPQHSNGVDHTEGDTNKMQENENNILNEDGKKKKKKKLSSNESLNPQHLNLEAAKHETISVTTATDNPTSKNQKTLEINCNPASGDSLSTCENTLDNATANKDLSTSIVLEAVSEDKVLQGEEHMKDATNSEMGSTTIVMKSVESTDMKIVKAKANSALTRKSQTLWVKEITPVGMKQKKLLIFDVNGLLADVVSPKPKGIKADMCLASGKALFKRPYLNDFLSFCFERFNVAIWSSRTSKNLSQVVNFLLKGWKRKLLFMWDRSQCTNSGMETREGKHKPLVVKDLRNVWDIDGPYRQWVKGTFDESNTLLVDDDPYKALLNPKYTGIFPASYSYMNKDDNFLAPKGELQNYLEGLAVADDVRTYVAQHPFGQSAIDEQSPDWAFYSNVIECLNSRDQLRRRDSVTFL